ncbi:hypothetical protein D3C79_967510 [compost metagenome]
MPLVDIDRAHPGHAADVTAGGEHLVAAGQQDAAHIRGSAQFGEVPRQQGLQLQAQGIGGVWAVQSQKGYAG